MDINNNNNNNNNRNEILFWKVIKNKFLLNKIIYHIQNEEWVKYDDHSQLHINNRIKFKDYHSLNKLIKNKQYQLLNYKLDNNDYISINKKSITTLFNQLSITNNTTTNTNNTIVILKEILNKLLSSRIRDEFEIIDLTLEAVKCNSIEVLRILINEPYSIIVYPSTLEFSIQHSHPLIVNELLNLDNNRNEIDNKKKYLVLAIKNKIYQFEMLQLILTSYPINNNNNNNNNQNKSPKQLHAFSIKRIRTNSKSLYCKLYKSFIKKYNEIINHEKYKSNQKLLEIKQFLVLIKLVNIEHGGLDGGGGGGSGNIDEIKNSITKDCENGELVWNQLLFDMLVIDEGEKYKGNELIVIQDKSTIDWILNCNNKSILSIIKLFFNRITFSTLELANYVYKESGLVNHICSGGGSGNSGNSNSLRKMIYYHVWNEASLNFDFNTIDYIKSELDGIYIPFSTPYCKKQIKSKITINQINQFNETNFKGFDNTFLESLINQIVLVFGTNNKSSNDDDEFSNIKLNFKNQYHIIRIIILFIDSIGDGEMDFKVFELLLNSNIFNDDDDDESEESNFIKNKFSKQFSRLDKYLFDNKGVPCYYKEKEGETRIEIIELIKKLIKRKTTVNHGNEDDHHPISIMVNYFYEKLISIKGITMNEVYQVYQLIKENSSIKLQHSVYHSFWYLHIKDIKYTYYILSPIYTGIFIPNGISYYNCRETQNDESFYTYEYEFKLKDYLNPEEFTFEEINNNNNLPFDKVIEMLDIGLLPLLLDNHSYQEGDIIKQLNKDLMYYLIIKRTDLFFKKLNQIKSKLDIVNTNDDSNFNDSKSSPWSFPINHFLFNSPSTTILPNSTLFNNLEILETSAAATAPLLPRKLIKNDQDDLEPNSHVFIFEDKLLKYIVKVLNLDEIIQVIKFNFHQTGFQNDLLYYSICYNRLDIVKLILDNFKIKAFGDPMYSKTSFIFENYFNLIQFPCKFESLQDEDQDNNHFKLTSNFLKEKQKQQEQQQQIDYQQLFNTLINQEQLQIQCSSINDLEQQQQHQPHHCNYNSSEHNIFLTAFIEGNIKLCELILLYYTNYQFKLTNQSISTTIKNNNIHIINHFLKYHSNMFNTDLINHLKSELNNHKDYKFLKLIK